MTDTDHVVLLDDDGREIGTALKSSVHGTDTALHLAFSCHVVNTDGQVLVTRRALGKTTWPGVWSNSFCGHPRPAEPVLVGGPPPRRLRARDHASPRSSWLSPSSAIGPRTPMAIVEHELCPVYTALTHDDPRPNPARSSTPCGSTPPTSPHPSRRRPGRSALGSSSRPSSCTCSTGPRRTSDDEHRDRTPAGTLRGDRQCDRRGHRAHPGPFLDATAAR